MIEQFRRYEFKFVLNRLDYARVQSDVAKFMTNDLFAKNSENLSYDVLSLYFDTQTYSNYFEKIDGVKNRSKFRVRTYGTVENQLSGFFLEEKRRNNNRVSKTREPLSKESYDALTTGRSLRPLEMKGDVSKRFFACQAGRPLKPNVLIGYTRRPYTSNHDGFFRVTFDSELFAHYSNGVAPLKYRSPRWVSLLPNRIIMEVKFNRRIPAWFHRIIQSYELERVSVSKFVLGVKGLRLAPDLS